MTGHNPIFHAAGLLREGKLVAIPTETVYGLAADARQPAAVRRIFQVKGRPLTHPLIVHLGDADQLPEWAIKLPSMATRLAAHFWPGPLTIILHRHPDVSDVVTGGHSTIGLRIPSHPLTLALLREFGGGVAAPSANRFGKVSPTSAAHVSADLGEDVNYILDGGECRVGIESTVVDLTRGDPIILRPGAVTRAALEAIVGRPVLVETQSVTASPGQHPVHYAPSAEVCVVTDEQIEGVARESVGAGLRTVVIAPRAARISESAATWWDAPSDSLEFAKQLYRLFRQADVESFERIVICPPIGHDLDEAIADRLRRAAAR